jgi:hypothetical protein
VTEISAGDLAQRQRDQQRDGGPPNLARVSRFPLGLPTGWHFDGETSDGDDVIARPDPAIIGPSGAPALRLTAAKPLSLWTAPYEPILTTQPHCVSIHLRGSWKGSFTALRDGEDLGHVEVDTRDDGWVRPAVAFTPTAIGGIYAARLDGHGDAWIDGFQVNVGEAPASYASRLPCELELACLPSASGSPRAQFSDEPALVAWRATGDLGGLRLRATVADHALRLRELPSARIDGAAGTIDFTDAAQPFGAFRIQAWLERDGQPASAVDEIVVLRLPRPRHLDEDAPDSPFGLHCDAIARHLTLAKAIGANWVEPAGAAMRSLGWWWLEPERGSWRFSDEPIRRYRAAKLSILGELGTAPRWASRLADADHPPMDPVTARRFQPQDLADYATYVRTIAARYRDDIRAWHPWDEAWDARHWAVGLRGDEDPVTSVDPEGDFVKLQESARTALDTVDPRLVIVGIGSTGGGAAPRRIAGRDWTTACLARGALASCQVVDYHRFESTRVGYPSDTVAAAFAEAIGPLLGPDCRAPCPVWLSAGSPLVGRCRYGLYEATVPGAEPDDADDAANRLVRWTVATLAQGVDKVFVASLQDYGELGRPGDHAALVCADGSPHPCAAAYAALAWRVEDCRFAGIRPLADGIRAYLFQARDSSRSCAVLLAGPAHGPWVVPSVGTISDCYGNPLPPRAPVGPLPIYVDAAIPAAALAAALAK